MTTEKIAINYLREQTARIRTATGWPGNISINAHAGSLETFTVRADCWGVSETDCGNAQIERVVDSLIARVNRATAFKAELAARMQGGATT